MEVDFMVHRVRLHNSIILILLTGFFACTGSARKKPAIVVSLRLMNKQEQQLTRQNGLLLVSNTPFSGKLFTLHSNLKDTAAFENYLNGKEVGEWTKYYPSKRIKEKRYFTDGKKTGEYIAWWENGNKQLHYFFNDDEYEGTCREWNEAGFLNRIMNYKKGHENGQQQWWYDNGKIKANYIIKNGRRFGLLGTKNCINVSDSIFKK
jgi:antitoxin component YwqK of YwqJK toxin-antitoxin module